MSLIDIIVLQIEEIYMVGHKLGGWSKGKGGGYLSSYRCVLEVKALSPKY